MTDTPGSDDRTCTEYEVQEVEKVNGTARLPEPFGRRVSSGTRSGPRSRARLVGR